MEKLCTLFISRIPKVIDDESMVQLLESCGRLTKWKRTMDPSKGGLSSFGFADFHTADAVLRSTRLLPAIAAKLGVSEPIACGVDVKCKDYLSNYATEHRKYTDHMVLVQQTAVAAGAPPYETPALDEDAVDAKAAAAIDEIVVSIKTKAREAEIAAAEAPPEGAGGFGEYFSQASSGEERNASLASQLLSMAPSEMGSGASLVPPPPPAGGAPGSSGGGGGGGGAEAKEKDSERRERERDFDERRRAREREQSRRDNQLEDEYISAERAWERREGEKDRARERDAQREKEVQRAREREVEADERRPESALSRDGYDERMRRMRRERDADEADRRAEAADKARAAEKERMAAEAADKEGAAEEGEAPAGASEAPLNGGHSDDAQGGGAEAAAEAPAAAEEPAATEAPATEAAAMEVERAASPAAVSPGAIAGGLKLGGGLGASKVKLAGNKRKVASTASFAVDDGPKMGPLVPIDYSAEEKAAVAELVPAAANTAAPAIPAEALKALIATIPTQRDALYAEAVDWETVEASDVIGLKLRPFVGKKMNEYLGEDEPSLVEHIVGKLKARATAEALEVELAKVLDDDAEKFVVKLWRMLIFEMKARQAGHAT